MSEPRFTIAVPVHNGGDHLRECMAALLAQEVDSFEVVVLENCSMDGTAEYLEQLGDPRVSVVPSQTLLSITENWDRIRHIRKREFLTVVGHDDVLAPNFLKVISQLIEADPAASLYSTHFRLIDNDGRLIRHCFPIPAKEAAAGFVAARLARIRDSFGAGYVMRSRDYDDSGGIPLYQDLLYADDALWVTLARRGSKRTASESTFSVRMHAESTSGGARYDRLLDALEEYSRFLVQLAKEEPSMRAALDTYGPAYYESFARLYYAFVLEASPQPERLAQAKQRAERLMNMVNPGIGELDLGSELRFKEWTRRSTVGRLARRIRETERLLGRSVVGWIGRHRF